MKCEICSKTPMAPPLGDGVAIHRVNQFGEIGVWRCSEHLTPEQRSNLDPETLRIVSIIEGRETR